MEAEGKTLTRSPSMLMQTMQTFISMFGVLAINVLSAVILSRGLTPDDRGVFLGITMWNGFIVGLCDVGLYMATIYLWGKGNQDDRKNIFTTLLAWAGGTGIVCVLIVIFLADWMIRGQLDPMETMAAYVFFISSLASPITTVINGVLAAENRFSAINLVRIGLPAVLTSLWAGYFFAGTLSVSLCLFTTAIIPALSLLPLLWQVRPHFASMGGFRWAIFRKGFWYGMKGYGGTIINVFGTNGTQLLLYSLNPSSLAFFQTAMSATGVLWAVPKAIGVTSFPKMVQQDSSQLHERLCQYFRMTALGTFLGALALGSMEPLLIPLLFGAAYTPAIVPALLLLPNAILGGLNELMGNALNSTGRTLHNTISTGVYVATTLGGMALTLTSWGIGGAALSMLAGYAVSLSVRMVWYHKVVERLRLGDLLPRLSDLQALIEKAFGIARKLRVKLKRVKLPA